jgi:hypothetical protein
MRYDRAVYRDLVADLPDAALRSFWDAGAERVLR